MQPLLGISGRKDITMRIVEQTVTLEDEVDGEAILAKLERAGRTCYKSEDRIQPGSADRFITGIIKRGHESVLEHASLTFRCVTDRGVSHELVRHRVASYSQESTRYCRYSGGLEFVQPVDFELTYSDRAILNLIEERYNLSLELGRTPQQARYFLPNGLKTEIVVTMNLRELRHFFKMRLDKAAHPQIRDLAKQMLTLCKEHVRIVFDDIEAEG
jgi:thymidylate synthase (FAD)